MTAPRLVEVGAGERMYATSTLDARFLYREIFEWQSYQGIDLPERLLVVDAGANIGMFTLFIKRLRPLARIVAFEPVPELVAAYRLNAAHFGLEDVTVHQVALSAAAERGSAKLRNYPLRPSGSSLVLHDQVELQERSASWVPSRLNERMYRGHEIDVSTAPLSAFLSEGEPVALLKVDVVGVELELFHGIADAQWALIERVVVDAQRVEGRLDAVCAYLAERGLRVGVRENPAASGDGLNFMVHAVRLDPVLVAGKV